MLISTLLTALFTVQVKATVVDVCQHPDIVTFEVPDGNLYDQYGDGLEVGDVLTATYNPVTKEFHVDW